MGPIVSSIFIYEIRFVHSLASRKRKSPYRRKKRRVVESNRMSLEYGDPYVIALSNKYDRTCHVQKKGGKNTQKNKFFYNEKWIFVIFNSRELRSTILAFAIDEQRRARDWRSLLEIIFYNIYILKNPNILYIYI